ncbi:Fic family protein [Candidatus Woesearchaeota archaeon]|nr:Fic family protein [Candidatus Woesearchaeota archaeon]
MTLEWRTTKIPANHFRQIELLLRTSQSYASVSDFIRISILEKLNKEQNKREFLLFKDIVFNESRILEIHELIVSKFKSDSKNLLNKNIKKAIEESLDLDIYTFLARFMKNFAKYHPFEDGNKRTALITIDCFLRLNNLKLRLKAKEDSETPDEVFIWQNSNQQKSVEEIKSFLEKHVIEHDSTAYVEIEDSIKENELMLRKLSR